MEHNSNDSILGVPHRDASKRSLSDKVFSGGMQATLEAKMDGNNWTEHMQIHSHQSLVTKARRYETISLPTPHLSSAIPYFRWEAIRLMRKRPGHSLILRQHPASDEWKPAASPSGGRGHRQARNWILGSFLVLMCFLQLSVWTHFSLG